VHLFGQYIEYPYAIAVREQLIGQVRSDETRAARDQDQPAARGLSVATPLTRSHG
jgi:hypothetical protein